MKLLAINIPNIDLSYFENKGLHFDITHADHSETFTLKSLGKVQDQDGIFKDMGTPDVTSYLETLEGGYQIILIGWNPNDYGEGVLHTGGYTSPIPLSNGTFFATIRQDNPANNNYVLHELHHALCFYLKSLGFILGDFMDKTPVWQSGILTYIPYYHNDDPSYPNGNFAQTWGQISRFLSTLNAPVCLLKRSTDDGKQTTGTLSVLNTSFDTLELPWLNNARNISCIPKGLYLVKWSYTWRFPFGVYQIQNVKRRTGIDFHVANYNTSLKGCIALGKGYQDINNDGELDVINSRVSVGAFVKLLKKSTFQLVIY